METSVETISPVESSQEPSETLEADSLPVIVDPSEPLPIPDLIDPNGPLPLPGMVRPKTHKLARVAARPPTSGQKRARTRGAYEKQILKKNIERYRLQGYTHEEIAEKLNTTSQKIYRLNKELRNDNLKKADEFDQKQYVGDFIRAHTKVIEQSWIEYEAMDPKSPARLKCLDLIRVTEHDLFKAMQDVGLVQKAAQQVEHKHALALPWTDDLKQAVIGQMISSKLSPQFALPTPDTSGNGSGKNLVMDAEITSDEVVEE